jgi:predicted transcriptional regulator
LPGAIAGKVTGELLRQGVGPDEHGFEIAAYRARWKLSPDHAVTAPAYSAYRSTMAKERGLGRKPAPVEAPPAPTGRRRPRRPTAS